MGRVKTEKTGPVVTYAVPKVLLMDMGEDVRNVVRAAGFTVSTGSFGTPYRVPIHDGFVRLAYNHDLPKDFAEQDIVVVDTEPTHILDHAGDAPPVAPGEDGWWAPCGKGVVDPRPEVMAVFADRCAKMLAHGSIFVVFAHLRRSQPLRWGHESYGHLSSESSAMAIRPHDNWAFLPLFGAQEHLQVTWEGGEEIHVEDGDSALLGLLRRHVKGADYDCTLHPLYHLRGVWEPLATNRYNAPVAAAVAPRTEQGGWVFLFPAVPDRGRLIVDFLEDVLPGLVPRLFPHAEGQRWVERPEYELPQVLDLRRRIQRIQEDARAQIAALEAEIEGWRADLGYLHDLLRGTGDALVKAVETTLGTLGFRSVENVDEERARAGDPRHDEDLRIGDRKPLVLVEVKGIAGTVKDSAALQVSKYLAPRMRELGRTDIRGLAIINHQRSLPPLSRERVPFRPLIVETAERDEVGLMTTWDLYRLARGYIAYGWAHAHVAALFYRDGLIDPVPTHYGYVGVVEAYWERHGALGVRIATGRIQRGDRLAYELPESFEERIVGSLQVDRTDVAEATDSQLAGIATDLTKQQARPGVRVFRISG